MIHFSLQDLLFRLLALVVVCPVHGYAIAAAAGKFGDPGPRHDGRCSFNPFVHLDPVGGLCMVVFGFGWIRPISLDPDLLWRGRLAAVLVAILGILAVLVLAVLASLARQPLILAQSGNLTLYATAFLGLLATHAAAFAVINLLPLPPFTGGHFLTAAVPQLAPRMAMHRIAFIILAVALIVSGWAKLVIQPALAPLTRAIVGG